jgi:hypothetical protein
MPRITKDPRNPRRRKNQRTYKVTTDVPLGLAHFDDTVVAGAGEIRPSYYGCGDVHEVYKCLMAWGLKTNAHLWTAVVYLSRAGKKDPSKYIEDLEKAITWIQIEIREAKAQIERSKTVGDPIGPRN